MLAGENDLFLEECFMNQLNSIILEGNLVRDAEMVEPAEGFKICKFSIAVNRWYRNKSDQGVEEVSYFDVEVYGKAAEACFKKSTKGRSVRVVGRLKQAKWKDDEGKFFSRVYVIAEHVEYKPAVQKQEDSEKMEEKDVQLEAESELVKEAVSF